MKDQEPKEAAPAEPKPEPVKIETIPVVGPCGEGNPCGGGFGSD